MEKPSPQARKRHVARDPVAEFEWAQAALLKESYTFERRCFETNRDGRESTYRPAKSMESREPWSDNPERKARCDTWLSIVRRMLKLRLDPAFYTRKVFLAINGRNVAAPTPNQLLSERWLDLYHKQRQELDEDLKLALHIQRDKASNSIRLEQLHGPMSMEEATLLVLRNEYLPLSALFRYCLAVTMPGESFERVVRTYQTLAALQYVRSDAEYDRVWGDFIPMEFKKSAQRIYRQLCHEAV